MFEIRALLFRFIESLLLGLPVPGIFLSKEPGTNRLLVIDGQQRLRSLEYFYNGVFAPTAKEFALTGVVGPFEGRTYKSLEEDDRRRLDDSILHATIVKQDEPTEDQSSIYFIFERLNTGGVVLQPQQIRAAIYYGDFQGVLKKLNSNAAWRKIFGAESKTLRDQELILRFLALYFSAGSYSRPMKDFLNTFMGRNRRLQRFDEKAITAAFTNTIETIDRCLGDKVFRVKRTLNAAVFDAVMVGLARRLSTGDLKSCDGLRKAYASLLDDDNFKNVTARATADEESVKRRLDLATAAFAKIK